MTDKKDEALKEICIKCRSNEWGPDTPRKEILNWMHDKAAQALDEQPVQQPRSDYRDWDYQDLEDEQPAQQEPLFKALIDSHPGLSDEIKALAKPSLELAMGPSEREAAFYERGYAKGFDDGVKSANKPTIPGPKPPQPSKPWAGLTEDEVWHSNEVMALNAEMGLPMNQIMAPIAWTDAKLREKNA